MAIFGVPSGDALKASLDADAILPGGLKTELAGSSLREPPRDADAPDAELGEGFLPAGADGKSNDGWSDPFQEKKLSKPAKPERTADASDNPFDGIDLTRGERTPRSRPNTPLSTKDPGAVSDPPSLDEIPFGEPPSGKPARKPSTRRDPKSPAPRAVEPPPAVENVSPPAAPPVRDWRAATARLKQLGITDFHLTPSDGEQPFLFTCRMTSPQNPRVVRRFESESADPLQAVEDVLKQVEEWVSRR
jgi:hypothetical protein